jgi:hypothetical protein
MSYFSTFQTIEPVRIQSVNHKVLRFGTYDPFCLFCYRAGVTQIFMQFNGKQIAVMLQGTKEGIKSSFLEQEIEAKRLF